MFAAASPQRSLGAAPCQHQRNDSTTSAQYHLQVASEIARRDLLLLQRCISITQQQLCYSPLRHTYTVCDMCASTIHNIRSLVSIPQHLQHLLFYASTCVCPQQIQQRFSGMSTLAFISQLSVNSRSTSASLAAVSSSATVQHQQQL